MINYGSLLTITINTRNYFFDRILSMNCRVVVQ